MSDAGTDGFLSSMAKDIDKARTNNETTQDAEDSGWEQVDSKRFSSMKHDPNESRLSIIWKNGTMGHYEGVTQEEYEALRMADSVGTHLGQFIIPNHKYVKAG